METNNNKKIRSTTVPKVKWSDEAISKLSYRGSQQRLKVNIENPPIKSLYIRWTPTTNKKKLCFNYTFEGNSLRKYLGDFSPGVRGTKYYTKVINQLIETHKDDDGNWTSDPREKVLSKQYILKSQRKTLRQVIRMYIEAECPRKNVKGNIDCDTAQTYARYLLGYNKRLTKLKFTNNRKGWGQIELIRDDKMVTWGDFWKTYGPGEYLDNSKNRNPREDKSAIEMCAVSNAANLKCPINGLTFPSVGVYDIAKKMIPKSVGGLIDFDGQVEVISSIDFGKKEIPNDLRWGVYIVIKAQNEYVKNCFKDYGMVTDSSGNYSAIWRPYHYIGLELAQSIYSIALDNRATGFTKNYNADVASYAKKDLKKGDMLDGEGGFCARGRLVTSEKSKKEEILPLGLTDNAVLKRDVNKDSIIKLKDVELNLPEEVVEAREYQYNIIK